MKRNHVALTYGYRELREVLKIMRENGLQKCLVPNRRFGYMGLRSGDKLRIQQVAKNLFIFELNE